MEDNPEKIKLELEPKPLRYLNIARKWSMFLAILGFIFLGLLIILGLITGTFLSVFNSGETSIGIPEPIMGLIFVAAAIICFFPGLFLYRFSKYAAVAVKALDKLYLQKALNNLKLHFVFVGILIIVCLAIYIAILIISGSSVSLL